MITRRAGRCRPLRRGSVAALAILAALAVAALVGSPSPTAADGNEAPGAPPAFRNLTAGVDHSCAILADGRLKCWGLGDAGQLGQGTTDTLGARAVEMGAGLPAIDLGTGRTVLAVAVGAAHTCALLDDHSVRCWGSPSAGRLGRPLDEPVGDEPGEMGDALPAVDLGTGRTATAVTAGWEHTCALLDDGRVKCWGASPFGALGTGDTQPRGDDPGEMGDALPAVPLGRPAVAITAGLLHTCALLDDGRVSCWGYGGASGGVGAFGTVPLGTSRTAIALSAGGGHTCALLDDHTVKCWGANGDGQLGLGDLAPRGASSSADMGDNLPPVDLGVGRTALGVSAGASSTCALLDDHTVKCWGANGFGQLGQGGTARLGDEPGELGDDLPPVALGTGRTALSVTSGERHTCAVRDDRGLRCWGANPHGELGIGRGVERVGDDPGEMGDALPPVDVAGTGRGVTGVVTDAATGAAIPEALVGVLAAPDYAPVGTGVTDRRGRFGVDTPAGSYLVYAVAGGRSGFHGEPTPVTVTAAYAPADVETRTGRGVIEGRVVDGTGGAPIAGAWVLATDAATGDPARGTVQVSDGFQVTGLVARPHHLIAIDPTGAHPPRAHPSAPTPAGSVPVDVMADAVTEADVTLPPTTPAATTAALSGRVDLDGGSGRSGVWVLAFRAADLAFVRGTVSENDGRWLLWVPPGEYKVAFVDPDGTLPMEWYGDQGPGGVADATPVTAPRNGVVAALTPTTGTIRAIVTRNGIPWSHVWVAAIGPHGVAGTDALRGVDDYTIGGLPVGTYRLAFVEPPGVRTEYWSDGPTYALADPVTVTAGGTTTVSGDLAAPP